MNTTSGIWVFTICNVLIALLGVLFQKKVIPYKVQEGDADEDNKDSMTKGMIDDDVHVTVTPCHEEKIDTPGSKPRIEELPFKRFLGDFKKFSGNDISENQKTADIKNLSATELTMENMGTEVFSESVQVDNKQFDCEQSQDHDETEGNLETNDDVINEEVVSEDHEKIATMLSSVRKHKTLDGSRTENTLGFNSNCEFENELKIAISFTDYDKPDISSSCDGD